MTRSTVPRIWLALGVLLCSAVMACGDSSPKEREASPASPEATSDASTSPTREPTEDAGPAATPAPPATAAAPAFAGLWGAENDNELLGFTMFISPGESPDGPWTIDLASVSFTCPPGETADAWLVEDCSGPEGVSIASLSVPKAPGEAATLAFSAFGDVYETTMRRIEPRPDAAEAFGVERVWRLPPSPICTASLGIWAEDGFVFSACRNGVVQVIDGSTGRLLSQESLATALGIPLIVLEVTYRDGILYAATTDAGLVILDARDPADPRVVGRFAVEAPQGSRERVTNVHNLTLSPDGSVIFLINQSHVTTDIRAVDVSNPAAPFEVGRYEYPENANILNGAHDIYLTERDGRTYGYFNRLRSGLEVLDVTDPAAITKVGSLVLPATVSHSGWFFDVDGHHYFAHTDEGFDRGMTVLNVDNVAAPEIVSTFRSRPGISIHNLRVHDGIAYIAYYVDGLRVVDLRDPANPVEIAHYDTLPPGLERSLFSGAWGVDLDRGLIFVSDSDTGVYGLRLTQDVQ